MGKKIVKSGGVMLRGSTNDPWGPDQITYAALASTDKKGQYRLVAPPGTYDLIGYPTTSSAKRTVPLLTETFRQMRRARTGASR